MKKAMFFQKKDGKIQCQLCPRKCIISEGKTGFCGVRKNIDGTVYTLVYDKIYSMGIDPIEKKPLHHFAPGSHTLSICTVGCNFRCKFCCNWSISQESSIRGENIPPEEIVELAKKNNCQGISYTYTEPTIFFELAYETAKIAHKEGLFNNFVTNGYTNPEPIRKIAKYLDAATVDFKGSGEKEFMRNFSSVPDPSPIFRALKEYKKRGVHLEITDLLVPKVGDSMEKVKELVVWIKKNLGEETPVQFLGFSPEYKARNLSPTPISTLEKAWKIAKEEGMKYAYVYASYDPGNPKNNTYCPKCGEMVIARFGCSLVENRVKNGKCPRCEEKILLRGSRWMKK